MRGRLVVAATAFGVAGVLHAGTAGGQSAEGPAAYRPAAGASPVRGATGTGGNAPVLAADPAAYTDSIAPGESRSYGVELDDRASAYVSAVAVPRPGSRMGLRDGIDVSLLAPDGTACGGVRHRSFASAGGAYPLADSAERVVKAAGGACATAGTYRFVVRRGDATGGDAAPVQLELKYTSGPPRHTIAAALPSAPGGWSSQAPSPRPTGRARAVRGGTGFDDAAEIAPGAWQDRIRPGETRFYRVRVDAGEQLFADAEFGSGAAAHGPYVVGGLRVGLNNPGRGYAMNRTGSYQGRPATVSLATPPAANDGGGDGGEAARGMSLPGWYYLQVSVSPKVREDGGVPVALAVSVAGARPAVATGGGAGGGGRQVTGVEPVAAAGPARRGERLRILGYAGIGTGSALLIGLGAWSLAARRRDE
ncbi:hypothetical protein [Streptomyces sp. NPDC049585]|uniref:hypothetical protein n=1 Tax=Streptomyces sp. NPDC049585 TaxID=3155154 RepID=UPI0034277AB4